MGQGRLPVHVTEGFSPKMETEVESRGKLGGHAVSVLLGVETVGGLSIGGDGRRAVGSLFTCLAPS